MASNEFPAGSSLITYAEPIGLAWIADGAGVTSAFTVDFELRNPGGELLAEQKAFGNFKIDAREPLFEIFTPAVARLSLPSPAGGLRPQICVSTTPIPRRRRVWNSASS
ncbi:MAG: hypothetical protein KL863_18205 [Rhizobium sp.]|nr:hypothetical protein [Rhizobium sp.]